MYYRFLIVIILLLNCNKLITQVFKVDTSSNPIEIVNNYFLGKNNDGIKIKNISYYGSKSSIGLFYYYSNIQQSFPPIGQF
jgi:hypothetical protein